MPIYTLKLLARREIAKNTLRFDFEKPTGFHFQPGQYGGFTLIAPPETDERGITRRFSFSSTPSDKYLSIATRIQSSVSSAYKRVLNTLAIGSKIKFVGPTGIFTLHDDASIPAVFIAGGIGVAPFYSILRHARDLGSTQQFHLLYGNNTLEESAFLDELTQLSKESSHFKMVPVLAEANQHWQGETGFITHHLIKKYIADLSAPIFYICGSPAMVNALRETLQEMDIPETHIKTEDFLGY